MKRFFTIIICIIAFVGCNENIKTDFDSDGAIYFQLDQTYWEDTRDSIVYSFVGNPGEEAIITLRVMLMGDPIHEDREFGIVVNEELTTAKKGVHYTAIAEIATLSSDDYYVDIPLTLIKTEDLSDGAKTLVVDLKPSDALSLGVLSRTRARIIFSNIVSKPSFWDDLLIHYFGEWSRVKQEKIIEITNMQFEKYPTNYEYLTNAAIFVSRWFEENYPYPDENGNIIEPWY